MSRFDLIALAKNGFTGGDSSFQSFDLRIQLLQSRLRFRNTFCQVQRLPVLCLQGLRSIPKRLQGGIGDSCLCSEASKLSLGRIQLDHILRAVRQLALDFLDPCGCLALAQLLLLGALLRPLFILIINGEPEDFRQNALALARRLNGELIGAALQKECGIYEGVIVKAQDLIDASLGIAQCGRCEGTKPLAILDLELEGALAGAPQLTLAQDAIVRVAQSKLQVYVHLSLAVGNEVVVGPGPGPPPESPGDGVQEGRFSVPIVTR